jgi:C1A family cysteine protease
MKLLVGLLVILVILMITNRKPRRRRVRFKNHTVPTFTRRIIRNEYEHHGLVHLNQIRIDSIVANVDPNIIYMPYMCTNLSPVRDQGSCSICWAYSAVSMFTDRYNAKYDTKLTFDPISLAACCACPYDLPEDMECTSTCHGNYLDVACEYIVNSGLVEMGYKRNARRCSVNNSSTYKGINYRRINPYDPHDLISSDNKELNTDRQLSDRQDVLPARPATEDYPSAFIAEDSDDIKQKLLVNEIAICNEIRTSGPVSSLLRICVDDGYNFYDYKNGIYGVDGWICGSDDRYHAVEIVGYGMDKGVRYWKVKNSWGTNWGTGGYFKIIRGINYNCIESDIWVVDV